MVELELAHTTELSRRASTMTPMYASSDPNTISWLNSKRTTQKANGTNWPGQHDGVSRACPADQKSGLLALMAGLSAYLASRACSTSETA